MESIIREGSRGEVCGARRTHVMNHGTGWAVNLRLVVEDWCEEI